MPDTTRFANGSAYAVTPAFVFGYSRCSEKAIVLSSRSTVSTDAPGFRRATTLKPLWLPRSSNCCVPEIGPIETNTS